VWSDVSARLAGRRGKPAGIPRNGFAHQHSAPSLCAG
jgi:hypothetical protein